MGSKAGRRWLTGSAVVLLLAAVIAVSGYGQQRGQTVMSPAIYEIEGMSDRRLVSVALWRGDPGWFGAAHMVKTCPVVDGSRFVVEESHGGGFTSHSIWGIRVWSRRSGPFFVVAFDDGSQRKILRGDLKRSER